MKLAGIAHIQLSVTDFARSRPFYHALCGHFEMHCQYDVADGDVARDILYCIGGKTGLAMSSGHARTRPSALPSIQARAASPVF
jgi:hypothetical protein